MGLLLASGCAAHAASAPTPQTAAQQQAEAADLRQQLAERDQRLSQLESRLALLEAEQRELRYALAEREAARTGVRETVRIRDTSEQPEADEAATERPRRERPVLRLYEARDEVRDAAPEPALMPVPVVSERLPLAPVPPIGALPPTPAATKSAEDATAHYKRAIDLVQKRDFAGALADLNQFLARFAEHPLASKAMFWRGEVLFAQRDYARALEAFEGALAREPRGDKAADALLKICLCSRRLGSLERARAALEQLKSQFPKSDAARMAAEEDA